MTIKKQVILNLIQDLQRLPLSFLNNLRGRCQIKFGMTFLFSNSGFTLIELLVVVLIIGILAAVAVPQYQKAVIRTRFAEIETNLRTLARAQDVYHLEHGEYATNISKLDVEIPGCHCIPEVCTTCKYEANEKRIAMIDASNNKETFVLHLIDGGYCCGGTKKGMMSTVVVPQQIKNILGFTGSGGCCSSNIRE